jgi:hypothetical protein
MLEQARIGSLSKRALGGNRFSVLKAVGKGNDKTAQFFHGQRITLAPEIESSVPVQSDLDGVGFFSNQPADPVAAPPRIPP